MPVIIELRTDIEEYIKKHGLSKKWENPKSFLKTTLLIHRLILNYSNQSIA